MRSVPERALPLRDRALLLVPIDAIDVATDHPREGLGDIPALAASIAEHGLLVPVLLRPLPIGHRWTMISGVRRVAAVRHLGRSHVPALTAPERSLHADTSIARMLTEQCQSQPFDVVESANAYRKMMNSHGWSVETVARRIGLPVSAVQATLAVLRKSHDRRESLRGTLPVRPGEPVMIVGSGGGGYLSKAHPLASIAAERHTRLGHPAGSTVRGNVACGECWEIVIRDDEREQGVSSTAEVDLVG